MEHQVFAELLGNYGEFLGAIAVVVTLAYLATQIRQNTIAQRTNSQHIVSQGFNHVNLLLAQDRELLNLMYRGNQDFFSLSEEETMVYVNYTTPFLRTYEDAYSDYLRGLLEEEYWSARQGNLNEVYVVTHRLLTSRITPIPERSPARHSHRAFVSPSPRPETSPTTPDTIHRGRRPPGCLARGSVRERVAPAGSS